jgi:ABC-type lipoprotein release transport system permease subunit
VSAAGTKSVVAAAKGRPGLRTLAARPAAYQMVQSVQAGSPWLPVVISQTLADSAGVSVRSTASMALVSKGGTVPVRVVGVVPVIPGIASGEGVIADLAALQDAAAREGLLQISSGEWWIAAKTPAATAAIAKAETTAHPEAVVALAAPSSGDRVLESARIAVWIAAAATGLLAVLAIAAGLVAELRSRESEVRVLRAVGALPRAQAAGRVREWALLLALGVVIGLIDGLVVCALLVPSLARTAIPNAIDQLRTLLNIDVAGAVLSAAGVAATVLVLLAILARTVRAQARRPSSALGDSTSGTER